MLLLLSAGNAAHAQGGGAPLGKAYIDQIPRNLPPPPLRGAVSPPSAPAAINLRGAAPAGNNPVPTARAPIAPAAVPKAQTAQPAASPTPPADAAAAALRPPAREMAVSQPPAPSPAKAVGTCRIQAGVFSQRANADKLAKAMKPLGDVRLTEMRLKGSLAYSVALAGLPTRKDAESALLKLNGRGLGALHIAGCRA